MLEKDTNAAYMKAANASMTASIMLPAERAGWKYTVIVATMCFPSFLPSIAAICGTKVAKEPRMYANEHFNIPIPVGEVAYAYACRSLNLRSSHILSTLPNSSCRVGSNSPGASRNSEDSVLRWNDRRRVKFRLTRSPVFGCIIVTDRSCEVS
jgi:hypothetical protein